MDCSLPGASVHGIFQARILEWVAISSSRDLLTWYIIIILDSVTYNIFFSIQKISISRKRNQVEKHNYVFLFSVVDHVFFSKLAIPSSLTEDMSPELAHIVVPWAYSTKVDILQSVPIILFKIFETQIQWLHETALKNINTWPHQMIPVQTHQTKESNHITAYALE